MSRLELHGLGIEVPDGWEAELGWADGAGPPPAGFHAAPGGPGPRVVAHLANFMLPPHRGDYGSGAVELMDAGAIFVSLMLLLYGYVTVEMTIWRKKFREGTTRHDNALHDTFADSLINWSEVKSQPPPRGPRRFPLAGGTSAMRSTSGSSGRSESA